MPTPRYSLSTISYENRVIIAAGGTTRRMLDGECEQTDIVEIYLKESNSWYSTKCLPFPMCNFSMEILKDKCFVIGGITGSYEDSSTMLYSTISSLIENTTVTDPAEVRTIAVAVLGGFFWFLRTTPFQKPKIFLLLSSS